MAQWHIALNLFNRASAPPRLLPSYVWSLHEDPVTGNCKRRSYRSRACGHKRMHGNGLPGGLGMVSKMDERGNLLLKYSMLRI